MTSSINNITGDHLSSKLGSREDMARYAKGWDRIFGAKNKENVTVTDNSVMNTPYDRYYIQMENEYLDKLEEEAEKGYDILKRGALKSNTLKSETNKEE